MSNFIISTEMLDNFLQSGHPFSEIYRQAKEAIESGGHFIIEDRTDPALLVKAADIDNIDDLVIFRMEKQPPTYLFLGKAELGQVTNIRYQRPTRGLQTRTAIGGKSISVPTRLTSSSISFSCTCHIDMNNQFYLSDKKGFEWHFVVSNVSPQGQQSSVSGIGI